MLGNMRQQAKGAESMQEPGGLGHPELAKIFIMEMRVEAILMKLLRRPRDVVLCSIIIMMMIKLSTFTGFMLSARCFIFNISSNLQYAPMRQGQLQLHFIKKGNEAESDPPQVSQLVGGRIRRVALAYVLPDPWAPRCCPWPP